MAERESEGEREEELEFYPRSPESDGNERGMECREENVTTADEREGLGRPPKIG